MPYATTELTDEVVEAARARWPGIAGRSQDAVRLHGGEESAAFRLGGIVIRIGPTWRTAEEIEWSHLVAAAAQSEVAEALAPVPTTDGCTVIGVGNRPVSVWPFVPGASGDKNDPVQLKGSARLLARLHRSLAGVTLPTRPPASSPRTRVANVDDAALDRWLAEFASSHLVVQPLHGDYYPGNVIVRNGQIVAVLDWDEAFLGPAEVELATAACEWGAVLERGDMSRARSFVHEYGSAGGTAREVDDEALVQLYRERIRADLSYTEATVHRGHVLDVVDREYRARQLEVFRLLRPRRTGQAHTGEPGGCLSLVSLMTSGMPRSSLPSSLNARLDHPSSVRREMTLAPGGPRR